MLRYLPLLLLFAACAPTKSLFNGQDLTGWEAYGTERWYVEDGLLICESGPDEQYGYLATEATYDDFELELEFKQEADGNSGVFIRSTIEGTKITGWQVEVAPPRPRYRWHLRALRPRLADQARPQVGRRPPTGGMESTEDPRRGPAGNQLAQRHGDGAADG